MEIKRIAVIGGGTMGNGIAHIFALKGFDVFLVETNEDLFSRALATIAGNLDRQVKKQVITDAEKSEALGKISKVIGVDKIPADVQLVIEAIYENKIAKLNIFKQLEDQLNNDCIFASNTSSISITELSSSCRPDKFIGMHFMNPVPVMKLIEIIRGLRTTDDTFKTTWSLAVKLGKTPAEANDYPGFIINRILMPMINEAVYCLYHGVGSREDIDIVMKLGANHPMGPLALADLIGLDTCLAIMDTLFDGFKDSKYRSCPLLKRYVEAGWLGKKTGRGFYEY